MKRVVTTFVFIAIVLSIASLTASGAPAQNLFVVNIDGVTDQIGWGSYIWNPLGVFLDAGTYTMVPVTPSTPGADYMAFSYWPGGPWSSGYYIGLQSPQQVLGFTEGPVDLNSRYGFNGIDETLYGFGTPQNYLTSQEAFSHAVSGTFTITSSQTAYFGVGDSYYGDNTGGVSVQVTATPEPATICLLGLGALGLLRKRRA